MKTTLLTSSTFALVLSTSAFAGVNGKYKVTGSETAGGEKYTFTGTLTVSKYKSGTYSLKFSDGDQTSYIFTFSKPIKETKSSQTVSAFNNLGHPLQPLSKKAARPLLSSLIVPKMVPFEAAALVPSDRIGSRGHSKSCRSRESPTTKCPTQISQAIPTV